MLKNLRLALNDDASSIKGTNEEEVKQVTWYEYKRQLVSVEDKIRNTVKNQLKR